MIDVLKKRFPNIRYPAKDDICYATTNRQNAVTSLSPDVDLVLVIGSKNSSNSQRLVERAVEAGKPAYLIDDESELDPTWFDESIASWSPPAHPPRSIWSANWSIACSAISAAKSKRERLMEEGISFELPKSVRSLAVVS